MSTVAERRRAQGVAVLILEELSVSSSRATISPGLRTRAQSALRHLTSPHQLHDILSELSTMVMALPAGATFSFPREQPELVEELQDARVAPRNHSREGFYSAVARGALVPSAVFRATSGRASSALSRAVRDRRLFFVELDGIRAFPSFFLDSRYCHRDLEAVTKQLAGISGGAKWLFFIMPKGSLSRTSSSTSPRHGDDAHGADHPQFAYVAAEDFGVSLRTPLQAIEDGDIELVLRTAAAYAAS